MYCKYCGSQIDDDALFCQKCGKRIKEDNQPPAIGQPLDDQPTASRQPVDNQSTACQPSDSPSWIYKDKKGNQYGPMTDTEIRLKLKNGILDAEGSIRKNTSSGEWLQMLDSPFASALKEEAIKNEVFISDLWLWLLAILPILIPMALRRLGLLPFDNMYDWLISLALNTAFFFLDKREIEKAGIYETWTFMGLLLVPLYILIREIKTNHNFAPCIFNAFLFAVQIFIF